MSTPQELKYLYERPILDFVRISAEFCRALEQCNETDRSHFMKTMQVMLSMLYLKAALINNVPAGISDEEVRRIGESDYEFVRQSVTRLLDETDAYLDIPSNHNEWTIADGPVAHWISEDLADLYQALRELAEAFRLGAEEPMANVLSEVVSSFGNEWGPKVLSALRALHAASYGEETSDFSE